MRVEGGGRIISTSSRADTSPSVRRGTIPRPVAGYESLVGHVAVMPGSMDGCFVDGERVRPQTGGFYGGWITDRVVGPFKGVPGSRFW